MKRRIISTIALTAAVAATTIGPAPTANAGFEPKIPGLDPIVPSVDEPICLDKSSIHFGWCKPDYAASFDNVSPTRGKGGTGFVAFRVHNHGPVETKEPVTTLLRSTGSDIVEVFPIRSTSVEITRAPFAWGDAWIIHHPDGIGDEFAYIGVVVEDALDVDLEVIANADVGDGVADEANFSNNTATY